VVERRRCVVDQEEEEEGVFPLGLIPKRYVAGLARW
jgi:hypothetical protein